MRLGSPSGEGPGDRGPPQLAARALPGHALQARPRQRLDAGAGGRAGRHRRRRRLRPQGLLPRHTGGRGHRPRALPDGGRGGARGVAGGRRPHRRDDPGARAPPRPPDMGRADPLGGRHRGAALEAAHDQRQAVALRAGEQRCSRPTTTASARASPATAAARQSWVPAAARSSTSRRSSTPTRRTTRRRVPTTTPQLAEGLPTSPLGAAARHARLSLGGLGPAPPKRVAMLGEFRQFILRGNLVDLAVAVVIGTAFGVVVTALVRDLITPLIAAIGGEPDFSGAEVQDQRQRVPLRRLPQRAARVRAGGGGGLLPRRQAGERPHGALPHRATRRTARRTSAPSASARSRRLHGAARSAPPSSRRRLTLRR